jgi:hypothetical protein
MVPLHHHNFLIKCLKDSDMHTQYALKTNVLQRFYATE